MHLCPDLLAQNVDWNKSAVALELPIGPAVAGWRAFQRGPNLVDRPAMLGTDQRAIDTQLGRLPARVNQHFAGAQQAAFNQRAKGHARLGAFRNGGFQRRAFQRANLA